jgi:predicted phage baseplate assembly protein
VSELCGCCASGAQALVVEAENRPELSAVAFRVGTFGMFRQALLHAIAETPALAGLRSRLSDDYSIMLLELWAVVADVLSFYQERIANEGYLRTATTRDSVRRLARLADYQLRPGAAATARLAFTVDAGTRLIVPAGLRVQSVPAAGEQPQKFETLEPVQVDWRLNRLRIVSAPIFRNPLGAGSREAYLAPDEASPAIAALLQPNDRILVRSSSALEEASIERIDIIEDRVRLRFTAPIVGTTWNAFHMAYKKTQTFRLFGHGAPTRYPKPVTDKSGHVKAWRLALTNRRLATPDRFPLDGRYDIPPRTRLLVEVRAGSTVYATETRVSAAGQMIDTVGPLRDTVTVVSVTPPVSFPAATVDRTDVLIHVLAEATLALWPYAYSDRLITGECYISGRRSGWDRIEVGRVIERKSYKRGVEISVRDIDVGRPVILLDDVAVPVTATVRAAELVGASIIVGPTANDTAMAAAIGLAPGEGERVTGLVSGTIRHGLGLSNPKGELQVTIGQLPAQLLALGALSVQGPDYYERLAAILQAALRAASSAPTFREARVVTIGARLVVVSGVANDEVSFAPTPADATTVGELGLDPSVVRFVDGVRSAPVVAPVVDRSGMLRITEGLRLAYEVSVTLTAAWQPRDIAAALLRALQLSPFSLRITADDETKRLLILPDIPRDDAQYLKLTVTPDGEVDLATQTAALLANVTTASHGESVAGEVVGDADASQLFQRFVLRKKPVTYVPAAVPGGLASTLHLRVNGIEWREVPTLYGASGRDEVFITRLDDDATMTVHFGDGTAGRRPPSGRSNIVATYRQGLGVAGRVRANTLSTLLDRPTGLKASTNPLPADGGADAESLEHARRAAPGTVRTFGRAVSLRDFEDITLASGEVAKCKATWVWAYDARVIHLTVAGQQGGTFSPEALRRIRATLHVERDPNHKLLIDNCAGVPILISVGLQVNERFDTAAVIARARQALLDALAFDALDLAQSIHLSDIYAVLQDVPGVVAADIDDLDYKNPDAAHNGTTERPHRHLPILPARPAPNPPFHVLPAELATIEVPSQDILVRATGGIRV